MTRFLSSLNQILALLLTVQLILGPCEVAWGQTGGAKGKSGGAAKGGGGKAAAGDAGGKAGGKIGVVGTGLGEETLASGQALSRAVMPDQYVLGPGDGLTINIWGEYEEKQEARVTPDGKLNLSTIGDLKVKGLTLAQVEKLLELEIKRYYKNVKVGISLTQLRVFEVSVLGDVVSPGAYQATPVRRVSYVVEKAGGVLPGASYRHIQVRRDDRIAAVADLVAFRRNAEDAADPFLRDGDVIFVPPMDNKRVSVFLPADEAPGPGSATVGQTQLNTFIVEIREGERFSAILSEIGGVNPTWDLEAVTVNRVSQEPEGVMRIPIDLRRYFLEKDESQNLALQPGDEIYIPAVIKRIYVAGSVKAGGAYAFIPGKSADAYLTEAGGPSLVADLSRSFIKRVDGTVEPYLESTEMNNGDSIFIQEKVFKTWTDYLAVVGTITGAFITIVGFTAVFDAFKK
jgi:protein involved in polysaccharide export with SLBB domain